MSLLELFHRDAFATFTYLRLVCRRGRTLSFHFASFHVYNIVYMMAFLICVYFTIASLCENPRRKEGATDAMVFSSWLLFGISVIRVRIVDRPNYLENVAVNK